ncbi:uncharacterized protein PAC_18545 [Phialocephala subalpina]|uniref:ZZ-type domain-containing protein n=1 Tax=Phialocephala subalpina TaxID=576137 RepID=A0A1L7XUF3_9HELO|nr:uncharacterized protein PAC_18545 [Phialocephala subalpina]
MLNFICDGCRQQIPPQKARIHCQTCLDYDSCTNCYVLGQFSGNHTAQHPLTLVRNSGVSGQLHPSPQSDLVPSSGNGQRGVGPQPAGNAPLQRQQNNRQPPSYAPKASNPPNGQNGPWTPLFNPDSSPAPIFVAMMQQIFSYLDPSLTGSLTPEAYSPFMEAQGYSAQQNIFEYILRERPRNQPQSGGLRSTFSSLLSENLGGPTNPMPLLILRGFINGGAMDILANTSQGWAYLNRALRSYQIPIRREKGDVQREIIPMVTPPHIQALMQQIQQNALRHANNQLQTAR